jgi:hypothetical protein
VLTVVLGKNTRPDRHREDYKVQKLVERVETKLALQAKTMREPQTNLSN